MKQVTDFFLENVLEIVQPISRILEILVTLQEVPNVYSLCVGH